MEWDDEFEADDTNDATFPCPECGQVIAADAEICPGCGYYMTDEDFETESQVLASGQPTWVLVTAALLLFAFLAWFLAPLLSILRVPT